MEAGAETWITLRQAEELTRIPYRTWQGWCRNGKIPFQQLGDAATPPNRIEKRIRLHDSLAMQAGYQQHPWRTGRKKASLSPS